ncbi:2'-5' RNA ligase family protein [Clostridium sp. CTA-7]
MREKYDPLANCIDPHITTVFPFESDIYINELKEHFNEALKDVKKFSVSLKDLLYKLFFYERGRVNINMGRGFVWLI